MKELDCVKIVQLLEKDRNFDGTRGVMRSPKVGDIGTIVHYQEDFCIIECVNSDGYTIWLADFLVDELEIIENDSNGNLTKP